MSTDSNVWSVSAERMKDVQRGSCGRFMNKDDMPCPEYNREMIVCANCEFKPVNAY